MTTTSNKHGLSGSAAPQHQVIIARLIMGINKIVKYPLMATPETKINIKKAKTSTIIPDIVIWDITKKYLTSIHPSVIIEVCKDKSFKKDIGKANNNMAKTPSIIEAFVYNYDTEQVKLLKKSKNPKQPIKSNNSKSQFGFDLLECLKFRH